jgi:hypothetical protein
MKNPIGVVFFLGLLIYILMDGYYVWSNPKKYLEYIHQRREKFRSQFSFLPNRLLNYIYFYEQPQLSIWWARIGTIIFILICILGIIAATFGPI